MPFQDSGEEEERMEEHPKRSACRQSGRPQPIEPRASISVTIGDGSPTGTGHSRRARAFR